MTTDLDYFGLNILRTTCWLPIDSEGVDGEFDGMREQLQAIEWGTGMQSRAGKD